MIYLSLLLIIIGVFLSILGVLVIPKNNNFPRKKREKRKFCILIPARNESLVIEDLLISIEKQTMKIPSEDVYIIVEDKKDLTISIAKEHNMNIVFRKDLTKKRKGYALDDAIKEILNDKKEYTAYFILDADNVLDKNFIKRMSFDFDKGYDIGIGYRNTKNGDNLVACSSALAFSLVNTLNNESKMKYSNTLSISGTGFYIRGNIIESWGGFPFNSLTEDYELSLYCALNNLTTSYNSDAVFYDEQPDKFNWSMIQRTRWVKGYLESRKKYIKKIIKSFKKKDINFASKVAALIGITPIIYLVSGSFLLVLSMLIEYSLKHFLFTLLVVLLSFYLLLMIITIIMLKKESGKLNIRVSKIKLVLYNPIFLASFVICFFKALFSRNLQWKAIPHDKKL